RGLIAGDDAAEGGRNDLGDIAIAFGPDFFGKRLAEHFRLGRKHEDAVFLQKDWRAQARGENKVSLKQGVAGAENVEHFVAGHCAVSISAAKTPSMPAMALA